VDGLDDLRAVDALQVDRGDAEVGVPELALNDERLCLLDLDVLQAQPIILQRHRELLSDVAGDEMPVWVSSVRLLHRLYTEAGDLQDAERIARFAVEQLGQRFDRALAETRTRLAALEAEDA